MLEHTLILPETDARFAAELLTEAIEDLDVVLLLVFGKGETTKQIVRWADRLCSKTRVGPGQNLRKVVWIRDAGTASLRAVLDPLLGAGALPQAAVLNFHDQLKETLPIGTDVDPLKLEILFLKGHQQ